MKFVNAKPVYFPPMERKWGNDNGSSVAWKIAVIHDKDGSLGGVPNSYILINDGVNDSIAADAQACEIKPDWNAAVCKGDVGRLNFAGPGGGFGAGPPRPAGGCRRRRLVLADLLLQAVLLVPPEVSVHGAGATSSAAGRSQPQWQGLHRSRRAATCAPVPRSR